MIYNEMLTRLRLSTGLTTFRDWPFRQCNSAPQTAVADAEILRDLRDGLLAQAGKLNRTLTELRRMGTV
jgi:hypothetical protein